MIEKNKIVENLLSKLLDKFEVEGSNIDRKPACFMKEALELKNKAPFLDINSYLYFLSEMSVLILRLKDGTYVTFYGVDDWDEGLNIFDYPVPDKDGFHLVLDVCHADSEMLYFSYNSKQVGVDELWTAMSVEGNPGKYTNSGLSFIDVLNLINEDKIQSLIR